jgi:D-alanyl-D-alanine carboxypeptidase (penicillin-binding protein 5/6)
MRWGPLVVAVLAAVLAAQATASPPPRVSAPSYVVESAVDGSTLAARAPAQPRAIASITKLMTVLVALEHARLDETVVVPRQATGIGEATAGLRPGERVTVRDLVVGTLVPSGNDAATALALHVGDGSIARFVALMNDKARALRLRDTHFANPHGLDQPGHRSSAQDTVALLRAALRRPFVRTWASRRVATLSTGRTVETTDDLLRRLPQLVAGKTGHTADAGWSQVAVARAGGVTVYASVLGAPTREARNDDLESLLRWALAQYRRSRVIDPSRTYAVARTGWGRPDVRLVARRLVVRPAPVGRPLVERVVAPVVVALPVVRGQRLGEVRVYDGRRLVARAELVADRAVSEPGLPGKTAVVIRRAVHHLAGLVT